MYICILYEGLVPREVRRGLLVFWNCHYSWLWDTVLMLGIKSGSSARATSFLQYSNSNLFILIQLWKITHTHTETVVCMYIILPYIPIYSQDKNPSQQWIYIQPCFLKSPAMHSQHSNPMNIIEFSIWFDLVT